MKNHKYCDNCKEMSSYIAECNIENKLFCANCGNKMKKITRVITEPIK